jgi:phage tail tape-measure protein
MKHKKESVVPAEPKTPMLDVSTVGGTLAGTMVGAIAGPVGMVVGGVVGGTLGIVAGATLDEENARISKHDHELDKEIGVEEGDIGRPSAPPPAPR